MKKLFLALVAAAGLFSLASCGGSDKPTDSKPTQSETTTPTENKPTENKPTDEVVGNNYTTKLILPDGSVYKEKPFNAQYCYGDVCLTPFKSDENGIASKPLEDGNEYIIHVLGPVTKDYSYNPNINWGKADARDTEIQLIERKTSVVENGVHKLSELGAYTFSFTKSSEWVKVSFTSPVDGKISIESFSEHYNAKNYTFAQLFVGATEEEIKKGGVGNNNFKYEFDAVKGTTYEFEINGKDARKYPSSFDVNFSLVK